MEVQLFELLSTSHPPLQALQESKEIRIHFENPYNTSPLLVVLKCHPFLAKHYKLRHIKKDELFTGGNWIADFERTSDNLQLPLVTEVTVRLAKSKQIGLIF